MSASLARVMEILRPRLKKHEGIRLKPYKDFRGNITIGIGRCLDTKGISEHEAEYLLQNDMIESIRLVKENVPWSWNLDNDRFSVLAEMAFQMGIGGLLLFKRFLLLIEGGYFDAAAKEMLDSKWAREDSPKRALELFEIMRGSINTKGGDGHG